jgi:hypothetical protein
MISHSKPHLTKEDTAESTASLAWLLEGGAGTVTRTTSSPPYYAADTDGSTGRWRSETNTNHKISGGWLVNA